MSERTIEVKGLREYQKALKNIDKRLGPELRKGLNEVAEIVVRGARPLVPRRSGAAQASIKVGSTQKAAQIKVGGTEAPYFLWLDFGGRVGRGRTGKGTGSVQRPFIKEGRYIYPTLRAKRGEAITKLEEVLGRLAQREGF